IKTTSGPSPSTSTVIRLPLMYGAVQEVAGGAASAWAARLARRSAKSATTGTGFRMTSILQENLFDGEAEQVGDAERQGKRWVIFARLYAVDRLARYFEAFGKIALAPVTLGAQNLEAVLHAHPPSPNVSLLTAAPTPSPRHQIGNTQKTGRRGTSV